jgi:hypothetical protein
MSQKRKFLRTLCLGFGLTKPQFFRSGIFIQAAFPLSSISMSSLRPLRSTVITRFLATMGLSDSRQKPAKSYLFPLAVSAPAGLPGSSADLSTRAAPSHPGQVRRLLTPVASSPIPGFILFGGLATRIGVTRPKRVRLRCGSRARLARLRQWNYSHSRLLGYLSNGQSTRYPPFRILDRPGLSWHSEEHELCTFRIPKFEFRIFPS